VKKMKIVVREGKLMLNRKRGEREREEKRFCLVGSGWFGVLFCFVLFGSEFVVLIGGEFVVLFGSEKVVCLFFVDTFWVDLRNTLKI